ncbi:proteasome activator [Pseudonocardia sp. CA-107938]|uniref:proteasome activator n=1 Tax=Pseudonocardia sp. CA-107938 TaxID=3240021 RepID=UPI003D8C85F8
MSIAADRAPDQFPVPDPAKLLRVGSMIKQMLEEIRATPPDTAGRERLVTAHALAVAEVEAVLPTALCREFDAIAPHLRDGVAVTDAELRVAHAQLVGWLEGVFQGVQYAASLHAEGR